MLLPIIPKLSRVISAITPSVIPLSILEAILKISNVFSTMGVPRESKNVLLIV